MDLSIPCGIGACESGCEGGCEVLPQRLKGSRRRRGGRTSGRRPEAIAGNRYSIALAIRDGQLDP